MRRTSYGDRMVGETGDGERDARYRHERRALPISKIPLRAEINASLYRRVWGGTRTTKRSVTSTESIVVGSSSLFPFRYPGGNSAKTGIPFVFNLRTETTRRFIIYVVTPVVPPLYLQTLAKWRTRTESQRHIPFPNGGRGVTLN